MARGMAEQMKQPAGPIAETMSWIGLVRSSELRLAKPPARNFFP
jgi:hypothetical protein